MYKITFFVCLFKKSTFEESTLVMTFVFYTISFEKLKAN